METGNLAITIRYKQHIFTGLILCKPKIMAKKTFESALSRLETITDDLEAGELSLEKSLKKFDEGIALVEFCNQKLEEARNRVDLLLKKDDALTTTPFDEETTSA